MQQCDFCSEPAVAQASLRGIVWGLACKQHVHLLRDQIDADLDDLESA